MILKAKAENGASSLVGRVAFSPFGNLPLTGGMSIGAGR